MPTFQSLFLRTRQPEAGRVHSTLARNADTESSLSLTAQAAHLMPSNFRVGYLDVVQAEKMRLVLGRLKIALRSNPGPGERSIIHTLISHSLGLTLESDGDSSLADGLTWVRLPDPRSGVSRARVLFCWRPTPTHQTSLLRYRLIRLPAF